jgi:integrase
MGLYKRAGTKVWTMDFVFKGQRVRETTGMTSKVKAQDVYERRKQELKDGTAGIKKKVQPLLFSVAAKKMQEAMETRWSSSMMEIAKYSVGHLSSYLGKRLLVDIDAADIREYQKLRQGEGASNRTINIEVGLVRQVMKWHGQWERIRTSQEWRLTGMLKEPDSAGRALTAAEESMLLLECGRSVSRSLLPFVTLLLETGARYNTIRTLTWGQVDTTGKRVTIGKDKTDAGTGRIVPLSSRAVATLKMWAEQFPDRKAHHFVFPTEKYGLHGTKGQTGKGGEVKVYERDTDTPVGSIVKAWRSARTRTRRHCPECKTGLLKEQKKGFACACGVKTDELPEALSRLRLHDLRHSAVDRMVAARVPLTTIARIVGWSKSTTVAMAARYSHADETEMRRAVESISGGARQAHPVEVEQPDKLTVQ